MLKSISKTLLVGIFTILPVILTVYLLYWLATTSEQVLGGALQLVLPSILYFPGLGIVAGLLLIFVVGLLMKTMLARQMFSLGEQILYRLPLVKTVYRAMRDLFDFFSPKSHHGSADISLAAQRNRFLLMGIMALAGWDFYRNEWWHYQLFDSRRYPVLDDRVLAKPMMAPPSS